MRLFDPAVDTIGLARRDHQETAKAAAIAAFPRTGTQRKRVLAAVWRAGERGVTRDEISERLQISPNAARPRIKELIDGGWIEANGETRPTPLGHAAEVLVLTARAREEISTRMAVAA